MKKILTILVLTVLMTGCAKVTVDILPCSSARPVKPVIADVSVQPGSSVYIDPQVDQRATVKWTGPNGFSDSTINGGNLTVDLTDPTKYGIYTATSSVNGCLSDPDSFRIISVFTGAPNCTVSPANYNRLIISNGSTLYFTNNFSSYTKSCTSFVYELDNIASNGYIMGFSTLAPPVAGNYYSLRADCNLGMGECQAMIFTNGSFGYTTNYYTPVSGNAYCTKINGHLYITFCGATFLDKSTFNNVTITGNFAYN